VYEYLFSWNEDRSFIGAGHAMDLPLLFGADHAEGTDAALGLTAQEICEAGKPMRELWGTFARTGVLPETVTSEILSLHKL
jgi:para-nitrobenzyl esterase